MHGERVQRWRERVQRWRGREQWRYANRTHSHAQIPTSPPVRGKTVCQSNPKTLKDVVGRDGYRYSVP